MKTFLGLDVGTTSLKAAIFDETGKRLGFRAVDYTLDTDPVTGTIEFDAETYITMCEKVIAELSKECGTPDALSVDTQGETMILCDAGQPAVISGCPVTSYTLFRPKSRLTSSASRSALLSSQTTAG